MTDHKRIVVFLLQISDALQQILFQLQIEWTLAALLQVQVGALTYSPIKFPSNGRMTRSGYNSCLTVPSAQKQALIVEEAQVVMDNIL